MRSARAPSRTHHAVGRWSPRGLPDLAHRRSRTCTCMPSLGCVPTATADPVRGRAQLFASGGEQVAVHASLDTLMMLGRCQMALLQCASSFVTGPARRHEQLPIAHPTFASSRAWLADSCGMQKHAGFILNSVAKQLHGTRMATTRIHFGLRANVKVLNAVSRRELSVGVRAGRHGRKLGFSGRRLGTASRWGNDAPDANPVLIYLDIPLREELRREGLYSLNT